MLKAAGLAAVLACALPFSPQSQRPPGLVPYISVDAPVVALTYVHVVDGTGAAARDDQTIVLRGGRIDAAGPALSTAVPADARIIDLSG